MNDDMLERLSKEVSDGNAAGQAYSRFIKPFVEEKRIVLFEAFQEVSVVDVDGLVEIKRQLIAINALEVEIKTKIDTGKMAAKSIANYQESE